MTAAIDLSAPWGAALAAAIMFTLGWVLLKLSEL